MSYADLLRSEDLEKLDEVIAPKVQEAVKGVCGCKCHAVEVSYTELNPCDFCLECSCLSDWYVSYECFGVKLTVLGYWREVVWQGQIYIFSDRVAVWNDRIGVLLSGIVRIYGVIFK